MDEVKNDCMSRMDERMHISLRGSGKTTRIANKAVELINKDNPTKVIIVVDTYMQRQYMIRKISDILNNDEKMVRHLDVIPVRPSQDNPYGFNDWYMKLLDYCQKEDVKVLVDSDIPSVIKDVITKSIIVNNIALIEVPLEALIIVER